MSSSPSSPTISGRQPHTSLVARRRVFRRIALLLFALVAVVTLRTLYTHYTDPERIRAVAEAYLQRFTPGRVTVGSAEFSWWGGVHLFNVTLTEPAPRTAGRYDTSLPFGEQTVFRCRQVELIHDPWLILVGSFKIQSLVALEPSCLIVRNAVDGTTNIASLLRAREDEPYTELTVIPSIELRDARVRVVHRDKHGDRTVEDLKMTVRGLPSSRNARSYEIVWHGGSSRIASGHARLNLQTGELANMDGGLPWMSLEAVMIAVNAEYEEAGMWCDLLGLTGAVRVEDYHLGVGSDEGTPRSATIELDRASLSVPVDDEEGSLPPDKRYLSFEQVNGTILVSADGLHAEFQALLHGSECEVSADLHGGIGEFTTLDDIAFDVRVSAKQLDLPRSGPTAPPEQSRFIRHWEALAKFYRGYDPHGRVDVDIAVHKQAGADQPIRLRHMTLAARGCDALCRFFPYRVESLTGTVDFTPQGVFLRHLRGTHNEGSVEVHGWLEQPKRWSAVRISATGRNIRIDEDLYAAVSSKFRNVGRRFDPQGLLDIELALARPGGRPGEPAKWKSNTLLTFNDLAACYESLPYPLEQASGSILIDQDQVQVVDVRARSGKARIDIDGTVALAHARKSGLALAISATEVPFDDTIRSAIPDGMRDNLDPFHPAGRFDLEMSVTRDIGATEAVQTSNVVLRDVSIQHDGFPVRVENISGALRVTPDRVVIEDVVGRYGDAAVAASGRVDRSTTPPDIDVTIRCSDLELNDDLCEAAPPGLRDVLADWRVVGPISTETTLTGGTSASPRNTRRNASGVAARTVAHLDGVSVRHPNFPRPFEEVRANVIFDQSGARATGVQARYGPARLHVDFDTRKTERGEEGTLALTAMGTVLDSSIRDILPEHHRAAWDRRGPSGQVDLHFDRLYYRRRSPDSLREWQVDGRVELRSVGFRGPADIANMSGSLTVSGSLVDRLGGTTLEGDLSILSAKLFGRELSQASSAWSFAQVADGDGRFGLSEAHAGAYDGQLTAQFELLFGPARSHYNLTTTLHDLDIVRFVHTDEMETGGGDDPAPIRGRAGAHIFLSGDVADPLSKRGRGRIEIREGQLFRLPIMLAILNVINLSIPDKNASHDAKTDFFITGNRMEFRDILLRGDALALAGSGSMSLPDRGLDLSLVSVNPRRWMRVPGLANFMEGASREIVELHVTGPLAQPTVRARPFRGITKELKRLFKKKEPRTMQPAASARGF